MCLGFLELGVYGLFACSPGIFKSLHTYRSNIGCSSGNGKSAAGKLVLIAKKLRA